MKTKTDWRGGVLLVDKPSGPSSFDVVRVIRRHLKTKKVGHTGTLDPMADGLLVVCIGDATRVVPFLTAVDKTYVARIRLGVVSDTYDAEGTCTRLTPETDVVQLSTASIEAALAYFDGEIEQRPPMFSAIKIDGERSYAKARRGEKVEMPLRSVHIYRCELQERSGDELTVLVHCSKGTYIRSIAHDLGERLDVGGVLVGLRRLSVGGLSVTDSVSLEDFSAQTSDVARAQCLTVGEALNDWPRVCLNAVQSQRVRTGQPLGLLDLPSSNFLAYDENNRLLALMKGTEEDGHTKILRGFPSV